MSATSSPSPLQDPKDRVVGANLPQGHCRYILLVPGIKGQRCACVHFSLNRSTPGACCDCGHMACYHLKNPEPSTTGREVDLLKQRLQILEEQLDRERQGSLGKAVARVSELEELLDKTREEFGQEIMGSYRNITRVWKSVEQLERRTCRLQESVFSHSNRLDKTDSDLQTVNNRQMELFDADETIEERLEQLESGCDVLPTTSRQQIHQVDGEEEAASLRRDTSSSMSLLRAALGGSTRAEAHTYSEHKNCEPLASSSPGATGFAGSSNCCGAWTVHVSLLPTCSQPFPFERDTNAYKRCLSRGLHRTVVVGGPDSKSFMEAVTKAFEGLLKGRAWVPLQAKLCDAEQLQGLPMLRPLGPGLVDCEYDMNFLRRYCGVCDLNGKIESLYIAMRQDTLSWHFLRNSPRFIDGLENCWVYDHFLDPNDPGEDDKIEEHQRRSAGDIVPILPSLKRAASEITRANGLASGESDGPRTKAPRTARLSTIVDLNRRLETV